MRDGSISPAPDTDVYCITLGTALPKKWIPVHNNINSPQISSTEITNGQQDKNFITQTYS